MKSEKSGLKHDKSRVKPLQVQAKKNLKREFCNLELYKWHLKLISEAAQNMVLQPIE